MKRILFGILIFASVAAYFYLGLCYGLPFADTSQTTILNESKTIVDILRSVVETVAIIVAGFWTYERFIKTREDYPYPEIQHRSQYHNLGNGYSYLIVFISVTNKGKVKLDLSSGIIYVRQVLPLSDKIKELLKKSDFDDISKGRNIQSATSEGKLFIDQSQRVGWPTLGERTWKENLRGKMHELESGQTREIQFDFLFNDKVDVVEIISFFEFKKTGHWEYATLHSIKEQNKKS